MEVESSSIDLSSAPNSDTEQPSSHRPSSNTNAAHHRSPADTYRNAQDIGPASNSYNVIAAPIPATLAAHRQAATPPVKKQRKPRQPKDPKADKAPRKPRGAPGTAAASRKKTKTEDAETKGIQKLPPPTDLRQSRLIEPLSHHQHTAPTPQVDEAAKYSQNGLMKQDPVMQPPIYTQNSYQPHLSPPQAQPPPLRSSAIYDPVRSITHQPAEPVQPSLTPYTSHTPPRPVSRPGASPISSIIDPPVPSYPSAPSPLRTFTIPAEQYVPTSHPVKQSLQPTAPMEVDESTLTPESRHIPTTQKPASETPTRAASPKPQRTKEQPPPPPMGSGLLSASMFGGELAADANKETGAKGPNIVLHIPLKGQRNTVINFARMAEQKYGFAALYPRQAAQRERLAKVAAAGAALERSASGSKFGGTSAEGSGEDDISVDIGGDSENDGDIAMSGINGNADQGPSGTDGPDQPKRKRRKKVEEYDDEDPFIDNTEQIWESQAAASKDGFFVYRGPLVPEGEKATVERYVNCFLLLPIPTDTTSGQMALSNVDVVAAVEAVARVRVAVVVPVLLPLPLRKPLAKEGRIRVKEVGQDLEVARQPADLE